MSDCTPSISVGVCDRGAKPEASDDMYDGGGEMWSGVRVLDAGIELEEECEEAGGGGVRFSEAMASSVISNRSIAFDTYINELASYFRQNCSP